MSEVGYCKPPIKNRFSATNPPPEHKGLRSPYLTPILKHLLNKEITVSDPEVKRILDLKFKGNKAPFKKLILLRYLLNATQGDNQAIEGIMDRIDGKLKSDTPLIDQSQHYHLTIEEKNARLNRIKDFAKKI